MVKGGGMMMMEPSQWLSKAIGKLNKTGVLQQPISYSDVVGPMSAVPEHVAIGLVKELEEKADSVKDPTGWLKMAAVRYSQKGGGWKTGTTLSKRIGTLNKSGVLQEPVSWSDVAGPLLLMDEGSAMALIDELEGKAAEVKNPTNWLKGAGERAFKKRKYE